MACSHAFQHYEVVFSTFSFLIWLRWKNKKRKAVMSLARLSAFPPSDVVLHTSLTTILWYFLTLKISILLLNILTILFLNLLTFIRQPVLIAAVVLLFSMEHILEVYVVRMEGRDHKLIYNRKEQLSSWYDSPANDEKIGVYRCTEDWGQHVI